MNDRIRALLADDHAVVRAGIRQFLEHAPDIQLVAEADDGQEARTFGWGISEAGHNAIFVNTEGPGGWQNVLPATTLSHMGKHAPVLAVNEDGVPESVARYLSIIKPYPTAPRQQLLNHGWVIGGEETISWQTQVELDVMLDAYLAMEE